MQGSRRRGPVSHVQKWTITVLDTGHDTVTPVSRTGGTYTMKNILRYNANVNTFKVQWEGLDSSEDTW